MHNLSMILALALSCSVACGVSDEDGQLDTGDGGVNGRSDARQIGDGGPVSSEACEKMDILFVIDNSGSMDEEQANLISNFSGFATLIDNHMTSSNRSLDYRIAVTTAGRDVSYTVSALGLTIPLTEGGDNGTFRRGCGLDRAWMERSDGNLVSTFECRANVGTGGPGAEMPLLGLEWSLGARVDDGTNAGFLREDALLAIVMITDQDDCSRIDDGFTIDGMQPTCFDSSDSNIIPLPHYLNFLDELKGERGRWASAVIAGTGPGSCSSGFGEAAEASRMIDFVGQAGTNSVLSSICSGDLTGALEEALQNFEAACEAFPQID